MPAPAAALTVAVLAAHDLGDQLLDPSKQPARNETHFAELHAHSNDVVMQIAKKIVTIGAEAKVVGPSPDLTLGDTGRMNMLRDDETRLFAAQPSAAVMRAAAEGGDGGDPADGGRFRLRQLNVIAMKPVRGGSRENYPGSIAPPLKASYGDSVTDIGSPFAHHGDHAISLAIIADVIVLIVPAGSLQDKKSSSHDLVARIFMSFGIMTSRMRPVQVHVVELVTGGKGSSTFPTGPENTAKHLGSGVWEPMKRNASFSLHWHVVDAAAALAESNERAVDVFTQQTVKHRAVVAAAKAVAAAATAAAGDGDSAAADGAAGQSDKKADDVEAVLPPAPSLDDCRRQGRIDAIANTVVDVLVRAEDAWFVGDVDASPAAAAAASDSPVSPKTAAPTTSRRIDIAAAARGSGFFFAAADFSDRASTVLANEQKHGAVTIGKAPKPTPAAQEKTLAILKQGTLPQRLLRDREVCPLRLVLLKTAPRGLCYFYVLQGTMRVGDPVLFASEPFTTQCTVASMRAFPCAEPDGPHGSINEAQAGDIVTVVLKASPNTAPTAAKDMEKTLKSMKMYSIAGEATLTGFPAVEGLITGPMVPGSPSAPSTMQGRSVIMVGYGGSCAGRVVSSEFHTPSRTVHATIAVDPQQARLVLMGTRNATRALPDSWVNALRALRSPLCPPADQRRRPRANGVFMRLLDISPSHGASRVLRLSNSFGKLEALRFFGALAHCPPPAKRPGTLSVPFTVSEEHALHLWRDFWVLHDLPTKAAAPEDFPLPREAPEALQWPEGKDALPAPTTSATRPYMATKMSDSLMETHKMNKATSIHDEFTVELAIMALNEVRTDGDGFVSVFSRPTLDAPACPRRELRGDTDVSVLQLIYLGLGPGVYSRALADANALRQANKMSQHGFHCSFGYGIGHHRCERYFKHVRTHGNVNMGALWAVDSWTKHLLASATNEAAVRVVVKACKGADRLMSKLAAEMFDSRNYARAIAIIQGNPALITDVTGHLEGLPPSLTRALLVRHYACISKNWKVGGRTLQQGAPATLGWLNQICATVFGGVATRVTFMVLTAFFAEVLVVYSRRQARLRGAASAVPRGNPTLIAVTIAGFLTPQ